MTTYRVVELSDSGSGAAIHIARESEGSPGRHALNGLLTGARKGAVGRRFDAARAVLTAGARPGYTVVADGLSKSEANQMVEALREEHDLHLPSRRAVRRPRVHQQLDPDSSYLDPDPVYYVYELIRPDTNQVFYVGKGSERQFPRVQAHVRKARNGKKGHKFSVIRKLLRAGLEPEEHRTCEHLPERQALLEERQLVKRHGLDQLTNDAPGGQGPPTGDDHWTRKHPERVLRGDKHPANTNQEHRRALVARCRNLDPAKRARGERHGRAKLSDAQTADLIARFKRGEGRKALAAAFGITPTQVSRILRGKSRGREPTTLRHGNSKLAPEQRTEIRKRRATGERVADLARAFGVSSSLISYISKQDQGDELVTSS